MKNLLKTIKDFINCMVLLDNYYWTMDDETFEEFRKAVQNFNRDDNNE